MVKGITRRVIVVRSPDPRFFEQAIFFLREDMLHRDGAPAEEILAEANAVAEHYLKSHPPRSRTFRRLRPLLWTGLGCLLTGVLWASSIFLL